MRSNRSLQHHKPADHHEHNGQHTVVTDPQKLFSVNQQQHMQHQLQLHAAAQERRNSTAHHHHNVEQRNSNPLHHHHHHATERKGSTAIHPNVHQTVQPQQHYPTPNQLEAQYSPKLQNVKVEITEPKN